MSRISRSPVFALSPLAVVFGLAGPAPAQEGDSIALVEGLARLTLAPGDVVITVERGENGAWVLLTNEQGQLMSISGRQASSRVSGRVSRAFGDTIVASETTLGDQPVWVARGETGFSPFQMRTPGESDGVMILGQTCNPEGERIELLALAERGNAAALESLIAGLVLTPPDGAVPCAPDDEIPEEATDDTEEAAPEQVALAEDRVMMTLPPGASAADAGGALVVTLDDGAQVRVAAGSGQPILDQIPALLHRVDGQGAFDSQGLAISVVDGPSRLSLTGAEVAADPAVPARVVVPQVCLDGQPPAWVALIGDPAFPDAIDMLTQTLAFARPEGAVDCPDVVFGLMPGAGAEVPPTFDWVQMERFGLQFVLPSDAEVRLDTSDPDRAAFWAQVLSPEGAPLHELSLRVLSAAAHAQLLADEGVQADAAGLEVLLNRFAGAPMQRTGDSVTLDGVELYYYRNTAPEGGAGTGPARVLGLIAEMPTAAGLYPWFVITSNPDDAAAVVFEDTILATLGGSAQLPVAAEAPVEPMPAAPAGDGKLPGSATTEAPTTSHPLPVVTPPSPSPLPDDLTLWGQTAASGTPEALWTYLKAYPQGQFAQMARVMLQNGVFTQPQAAPAAPAPATK